MDLKGKRILLTGATGGLGQELALLLAQKGAVLTLVGRDKTKLNLLKDLIEKGGGNAYFQVADLNTVDMSRDVVSLAKHLMGDIDVLINNAGVLDFIKFGQQSDARIAQIPLVRPRLHEAASAGQLHHLVRRAPHHFAGKHLHTRGFECGVDITFVECGRQ